MNEISIIGGGISSLYYKYKHYNEDIQIYESSNRLGGKIMTKNNYGINTEYGAIRYEWGYQPLLEQLLTELNLDIISFPSFCGNKHEELDLIKVTCEYIWSQYHNKRVSINDITYEDLNNVHKTPWLYYKNKYIHIYDVSFNDYINTINNEWSDLHKLNDTSMSTFPINHWSLMLWLLRWTKLLITNHSIKTLHNGNNTLIDKLENQFDNNDIHLNHKLYKINKINNYYELYFENNKIVNTKQVILMIPINNILQINYDFKPNIYDIFNKLIPYKLGRIFVYITNPFWSTDGLFELQNYKKEELHTREVYFYRKGNIGLIMLYFDEIYFDFWKSKNYSEIQTHFEMNGFKNIIDIQTFYWDGISNPHAFYYLDKGINPNYAIDTLYNADDNLHIITDCTLEPGFIEGTLQIINAKL